MFRSISAPVMALLMVGCFPLLAGAQPPSQKRTVPSDYTATVEPEVRTFNRDVVPIPASGRFANGQVLPGSTGQTIAERLLSKVSFEEAGDQVLFTMRVIKLDDETRRTLYHEMDLKKVQSRIEQVNEPQDIASQSTIEPELSSLTRVTTTSLVTTALMNDQQVKQLHELVSQTEHCELVAAPKVITNMGQVAGIQQRVQRSFLSKVEEVEVEGEKSFRSDISVLNQGLDFILQADSVQAADTSSKESPSSSSGGIHVRLKMQQSRIVGVEQHEVYGIGDTAKTIQIPSQEIRMVTASQDLMPGQTLLVDPYFESTDEVASEAPMPLLGKVPYVSRSFQSKEPQVVKTHLVVLLQAVKR